MKSICQKCWVVENSKYPIKGYEKININLHDQRNFGQHCTKTLHVDLSMEVIGFRYGEDLKFSTTQRRGVCRKNTDFPVYLLFNWLVVVSLVRKCGTLGVE